MENNINQRFIGKILDKRYKINRIIGVGGMSIVFEAFDMITGKIVAVKVLKDEMAMDDVATQRFINESKAVSMLSHPNIVKVYDVSVKSSLKYIVMERVEGITLKSYIQRKGRLSTLETLSYTEQILGALAHAHEKGIVHRDIKPQNILLLKSGKVKISDFGIATVESNTEYSESKAVGTVYYISPEQATGKRTDCRTDIYSIGIMMYEMATGVLPFDAATPVEIARKHVTEMPRRPRDINPEIPLGLEQIILGAIEKRPDLRFASAEQMLAFVSRLRANPDRVFRTARKETGTIVPAQDSSVANRKKKIKKQSSSMFPIILGVATAFLAVFIVSGLKVVNTILENQDQPITIEVPRVTDSLYDDTVRAMLDSTLYDIEFEAKFDSSHPENTIIKQEPAAGTKKKVIKNKQKCTITLTISKGSQMVSVPDLTIMDYRTAQMKAETLGLSVILQEIYSDTVEIGHVISTSPVAKSEAVLGSKITIYYSKGIDVITYKVPALVGLTPDQATIRMGETFKVGNVTYAFSETVEKGKIISQSITTGILQPKGTKINLVISKGKDPSTTEVG